jgi:hypothetical protein
MHEVVFCSVLQRFDGLGLKIQVRLHTIENVSLLSLAAATARAKRVLQLLQ